MSLQAWLNLYQTSHERSATTPITEIKRSDLRAKRFKQSDCLAGIEYLRTAVESLNTLRETTFDNLSTEEILRMYDAWLACEWDIYPDQWSDDQLEGAIKLGLVPNFDGKTLAPIPAVVRIID